MKNLENAFAKDVVLPEPGAGSPDLTGSERDFLAKYLGAEWEKTPEGRSLARPVAAERVMGPGGESADAGSSAGLPATGGGEASVSGEPQEAARAAGQPAASPAEAREAPEAAPGADLEASLMAEEELRLVSFHVSDQVFAVPIMLVQEVLRAVPSTKLPAAPPHLAGVTNLRGRITPLVDLARLLDIPVSEGQADNFLIVCRLKDVQIGLRVKAIDTMYKAPRADIEWNIESRIGVSADLMAGLLKTGDSLVKILSVSRLFKKVLKS